MGYVFLVCAGIIATWFAVWRLARAGTKDDSERVSRETRAEVLRSIGLDLGGDSLRAYVISGHVHDVEARIEGTIAPALPVGLPGVTAITIRSSLPDQIVCRRHDLVKVTAAHRELASLPPRPTGSAAFDDKFSVVVDAGPSQQQAAGYRDAPADTGQIAWSDPTTLAAMVAQHLVYLHVRDGACQLAFHPKPANEVAPLLVTAVNVVRKAAGEPLVEPAPPLTFIAPARSYESAAAVTSWALYAMWFLPACLPIALLPPLRAINAETECGRGGEIYMTESDSDEGTSYGLHCMNDGHITSPPLLAHHASAFAVYIALICALFTVLGLSRWPKKAQPPR